jgi:hypothetical protein
MRSAARSRPLPEPWTFFVDRSLGGQIVANALRDMGERVEAHDDHFKADVADKIWLADVGARRWVVLTKDDRIRRNPMEREALRAAGVAAFFLGRQDLRGDQMAMIVRTALPAMKKALRRFAVPFMARVTTDAGVSVFEAGGQVFPQAKTIKG